MARSRKAASPRESPSAKTAWPAPAWAWMPPTTTAPAIPACMITQFRQPDAFALSQRRQRPFRGRSAAVGSGPRHAWSRWDSAASSSITTTMAGPIFSSPTGTSRTRSSSVQKRVSYAEPPHLFRNLGGGKFQEVTAQDGRGFCSSESGAGRGLRRHRQRRRARCAAHHQWRPALSVSQRRRNESQLAHEARGNEVESRRHWRGCARDFGQATSNGRCCASGSSYLSQSELVLTFGLGAQKKADSIEIQWPSGQIDKLSDVDAGQMITVQESKGNNCQPQVRQTLRNAGNADKKVARRIALFNIGPSPCNSSPQPALTGFKYSVLFSSCRLADPHP